MTGHRTFALLLFSVALSAVAAQQGEAPEPGSDTGEAPLELEAVRVPFRVESTPAAPGLAELGDYRIGHQDLLEIRVFDVEELDQTVRVAGDGSITMPLLGRLSVSGMTKSELEDLIADLLEQRYVQDAQVTVFIKEYESKRIAVSGAVKKPGTYQMLGAKTVLEMISMAGGLDSDYGSEIIIFRKGASDDAHRTVSIDLDELVYRANPNLNFVVQPGDILYVPAVEMLRIYVSGAVKSPNRYEIPMDEPVTVLRAVTLAGGTTDRASEKKVQVMRTDEKGRRTSFFVNLRKIKRGKAEDPILRKDDVVLVPEAFF